MATSKIEKFNRRVKRVRAKVSGSSDCPRLCVFKSNKFIYASLMDDVKGITILSAKASGKTLKEATALGEEIAKKSVSKKVTKVVFDKRGYKYHGRVKAVADGARKGGLKF